MENEKIAQLELALQIAAEYVTHLQRKFNTEVQHSTEEIKQNWLDVADILKDE